MNPSGARFVRVAVAFMAVAAAVGLQGCSGATFGDAAGVSIESVAIDDEARIAPHSVADLSGDQLFLPHFFTGFSVGNVVAFDSTLVSSPVYDVNLALDIGSHLSLEVMFGWWSIQDQPANIPGADSKLVMNPVLAFLQFYKDVPRLRSRYYVGAGIGYSTNSYDLGATHEQYVLLHDNLDDYDIDVSDGTLLKAAIGWERYSTSDAKLNLGIELSYVSGQADLRIDRTSGGTTDQYVIGSFPMDNMWMFRANITWHY
jgi:hypothetical protein